MERADQKKRPASLTALSTSAFLFALLAAAAAASPAINFVSPTPANNSYINTSSVVVNVSADENVSSCMLYVGNPTVGDGSDGNLTVTAANTVVNNYTYLTANASAGSASLIVSNASGFSAGDEVLVVQSQNYTNGTAGAYEFARVASVSGTSGTNLTLTFPLTNSYYAGSHGTTTSTTAQVVRVPQYRNVTVNSGASITAKTWDGYSGGIVAFRATGTVMINGSIDVSADGFYGGESHFGASSGGLTGSEAGEADVLSGTTGGGGGHATNGTAGDGAGGAPIGSPDLSVLTFGGGGGSGGSSGCHIILNMTFCTYSGAGGSGGGIIFIVGSNISSSGSILADGQDGQVGDPGFQVGGGGAGGAIYLLGNSVTMGTVNASGGSGGGGNGSVGRIRVDALNASGSTTPASYNGTYNPFSDAPNAAYSMTVHNADASTTANITVAGFTGGTNYSFSAVCTDAGNNTNTTETRTITLGTPTLGVSARIDPATTALTNDTLTGYCNGSDSYGYNLTYNYQWWLDGALNASGTTASSPQGVEVNAANVTTGLALGQNWTLSCQANNSFFSSAWLNSSVTAIVPPPSLSLLGPVNGSLLPVTPGQNVSINFSMTKDGANLSSNVTVTNVTVGGLPCSSPQLAYTGSYWQVNCTTSASCRDNADLYVQANDTTGALADATATDAYAFPPPPVVAFHGGTTIRFLGGKMVFRG